MRPRAAIAATLLALCVVAAGAPSSGSTARHAGKSSASRSSPGAAKDHGRAVVAARKESMPPAAVAAGQPLTSSARAHAPVLQAGASPSIDKLLLVSTLDGRITALDARSGNVLWSVRSGGPMVRVQTHNGTASSGSTGTGSTSASGSGKASSGSGGSGASSSSAPSSNPFDALIIPSRDGGILIRTPSGAMQQLPYRAQDLVQSLPMSAGGNILVGSKTTRVMQISLLTGRVLSAVSGDDAPHSESEFHDVAATAAAAAASAAATPLAVLADGVAASSPAAAVPAGPSLGPGPSIWLGRSDFTVKAFSPASGRHLWNLSYSELAGDAVLLLPAEPVSGSTSTSSSSSGGSSGRAPPAGPLPRGIYFEGETLPPLVRPAGATGNAAGKGSSSTGAAGAGSTSGRRPTGASAPVPAAEPPLLLRLAAHMTGELAATDARTGAVVWNSPPLHAPAVAVHAVTLPQAPASPASGQRHSTRAQQAQEADVLQPVSLPFAEVWPAGGSDSLPAPGDATSTGSGTSASTSSSASAAAAAAASHGDLFVGMLGSGQLFASPRSQRTIMDATRQPSHYWASVFAAMRQHAAAEAARRAAIAGAGIRTDNLLPGVATTTDPQLLLPAPQDSGSTGGVSGGGAASGSAGGSQCPAPQSGAAGTGIGIGTCAAPQTPQTPPTGSSGTGAGPLVPAWPQQQGSADADATALTTADDAGAWPPLPLPMLLPSRDSFVCPGAGASSSSGSAASSDGGVGSVGGAAAVLQCLVGLRNVSHVGADGRMHDGWLPYAAGGGSGGAGSSAVARRDPPYRRGDDDGDRRYVDSDGDSDGDIASDDSNGGGFDPYYYDYASMGLPARRANAWSRDGGGRASSNDSGDAGWASDEYDFEDSDDGGGFWLPGQSRPPRRSNRSRERALLYPLALWIVRRAPAALVAHLPPAKLAKLLDGLLTLVLATSSILFIVAVVFACCFRAGAGPTLGVGIGRLFGRTAAAGDGATGGISPDAASVAGAAGAPKKGSRRRPRGGASNGAPAAAAGAAAGDGSSVATETGSGSALVLSGSGQATAAAGSTALALAPASAASTSPSAAATASASSTLISVPQPQAPLPPAPIVVGGVSYRPLGGSGRIAISLSHTLGFGCHGTVVYAGLFDGRPVAVKRLLRAFHPNAAREIALLVRTDDHPAVVRYFACEDSEAADSDFIYIALERCESTLADAMARAARGRARLLARARAAAAAAGGRGKSGKGGSKGTPSSGSATSSSGGAANTFAALADGDADGDAESATASAAGVRRAGVTAGAAASSSDGAGFGRAPPAPVPSPATRSFLRSLVAGVAHLHAHRIVHRDLKPHNILLQRLPGAGGGAAASSSAGGASATASSTSGGAPASQADVSTTSAPSAAPAPWWRPLYPDAECHELGLAFAPKISDFGLGKQLGGGYADASTAGGLPPGSAAAAAAAAAAAGGGASSSLFIKAHGAGGRKGRAGAGGAADPQARGGGGGAGAGDAGSSSSAGAAGTVGWQAPEVLAAVLRLRSPGGGVHAALPETEDTIGDEDNDHDGGHDDGDRERDRDRDAAEGGHDAAGSRDASPRKPAASAVGATAAASSGAAAAATAALVSAVRDDARWRRSRAGDVWALGCLLFHVLEAGCHPFGESYEREARVLRGTPPDLTRIGASSPEAAHLLAAMLAPDPARRPSAAACLEHPFFWDDDARAAFMHDLSDRLEEEATDGSSPLRAALEGRAAAVFGASFMQAQAKAQGLLAQGQGQGDAAGTTSGAGAGAADGGVGADGWAIGAAPAGAAATSAAAGVGSSSSSAGSSGWGWNLRVPSSLLADSGRFRAYSYRSLADCLRLLRNKRSHYHSLPLAVRREAIGCEAAPAALVPFFLSPARFPRLLLACWEVACERLAHEPAFAGYLGPRTSARHAAAARRAAAAAAAAAASAPGGSVSTAGASGASLSAAAPSTPAVAVTGPQRQWLPAEDGWLAAAAAASARVAAGEAGMVVPVTVELGLDSTAAASAGAGYLSSSDPLMKVLGGGLSGAALRGACDAFAEAQASGVVVVVAAHTALNSTGFAGGAHAFATRYKSRCCGDFDRLGGRACPRGVRCDFAHGGIELRVRPEPAPRSLALPSSAGAGAGADAEAAADDPVAAARLHQQQLDRLTLLFPLSVAGWPSLGPPPPIVASGSGSSSAAAAAGGSMGSSTAGGAAASPAVARARSGPQSHAAGGSPSAAASASASASSGAWGSRAGSGPGSAAVRSSLFK